MTVLIPAILILALVICAIAVYLAFGPLAKRAPSPAFGQPTNRSEQALLEQISQRASQRLLFRRPMVSDRPFYMELVDDPTAAEANGWGDQEKQILRNRFDNSLSFASLQAHELVAVDRATEAPVATATFNRSQLDSNSQSIGIQVHPESRRQGFGRETTAAAILFLLHGNPAKPIHLGTRKTNLGMQRIMNQLGYEPFDITTRFEATNGEFYPALWYRCDTPPAGLFS